MTIISTSSTTDHLPEDAGIFIGRVESLVGWNNPIEESLARVQTAQALDKPPVSWKYKSVENQGRSDEDDVDIIMMRIENTGSHSLRTAFGDKTMAMMTMTYSRGTSSLSMPTLV